MDLMPQLTQIGFTVYEAKVYLALLSLHPATGYQLSKESGVPRSMVYEALKRLHGRGAALETVEGRSTLYRPLPPELLLDHHKSEHDRLVKDLRAGLRELYTSEEDDRVWSLNGRSTVLSYANQMIRAAQSELYLVLTDEDLPPLEAEIGAAHNRDVDVNTLLTGGGELEYGRIAYHPPLESELQGLTSTLLVVADDAELLIASDRPRRPMTATITRSTDLVLIGRQFVWMELFTQRIYAQLGADLLQRLDPDDRQIFESLSR
jgi:Cd2+/Zn2+-exporting ATPase